MRLVSQQGAEEWEQKAEELKSEFPEVEPQMLKEGTAVEVDGDDGDRKQY